MCFETVTRSNFSKSLALLLRSSFSCHLWTLKSLVNCGGKSVRDNDFTVWIGGKNSFFFFNFSVTFQCDCFDYFVLCTGICTVWHQFWQLDESLCELHHQRCCVLWRWLHKHLKTLSDMDRIWIFGCPFSSMWMSLVLYLRFVSCGLLQWQIRASNGDENLSELFNFSLKLRVIIFLFQDFNYFYFNRFLIETIFEQYQACSKQY